MNDELRNANYRRGACCNCCESSARKSDDCYDLTCTWGGMHEFVDKEYVCDYFFDDEAEEPPTPPAMKTVKVCDGSNVLVSEQAQVSTGVQFQRELWTAIPPTAKVYVEIEGYATKVHDFEFGKAY